MKRVWTGLLLIGLVLGGCSAESPREETPPGAIEIGIHRRVEAYSTPVERLSVLPAVENNRIHLSDADISGVGINDFGKLISVSRFNTNTVWPENNIDGYDPRLVMEFGKDPGLNIRTLHEHGIDGSGVSIGIVDVTLFTEHSEYKDNLVH